MGATRSRYQTTYPQEIKEPSKLVKEGHLIFSQIALNLLSLIGGHVHVRLRIIGEAMLALDGIQTVEAMTIDIPNVHREDTNAGEKKWVAVHHKIHTVAKDVRDGYHGLLGHYGGTGSTLLYPKRQDEAMESKMYGTKIESAKEELN